MKATWTMPDYLLALRTKLQERAGLDGVQIAAAPVAKDLLQREAIVIIDVDTDEENAALGANRKSEVYRIEGIVWVLKKGKGDSVADTARARAAVLMAEVEDLIRESPDLGINAVQGSQIIRHSYISLKNLRQGMEADFRRAQIEFNITVSTKIGT